MRGICLDEGMLQAFVDGELSDALSSEASTHIASCAQCASALEAVRAEAAFFADAFSSDEMVAVPTELLRARIDAAIAEQSMQSAERKGTVWNFGAIAAWLASSFNLQPRLAGAFASVVGLIALGIVFGIVFMPNRNVEKREIAANVQRQESAPTITATQNENSSTPAVIATPASPAIDKEIASENKNKPLSAGIVNVADKRERNYPSKFVRVNKSNRSEAPINDVAETNNVSGETIARNQAVPGEEKYLRTIASLAKAIEVSGEDVLRPQIRADYERNLAVIDKAIDETRKAVARNPKDADASAFLFSAYRTKIELLSTVADQAQVATLGR